MKFETVPQRPTLQELETNAAQIFDRHFALASSTGGHEAAKMFETNPADSFRTTMEMVIRDLRNTAEDPNSETNPDSVVKSYPGYQGEDFSNLADLLEAKLERLNKGA